MDFVLLLRQLMNRDPNLRPSADHIIKHPLIRDDIEWRLEQENQKVAALQKQVEELEREILKSRKQRFGPTYPKRVNKFDMTDLKTNLMYTKNTHNPIYDSSILLQRDCNTDYQSKDLFRDVTNQSIGFEADYISPNLTLSTSATTQTND